MSIKVRRPTSMGSNVDVLVPERDEDEMKAVLRRVLDEARNARGAAFFADEDATVFVGQVPKPFTRGDDLDAFVDGIVKMAVAK